ncbi:hypothetical protein NC653_011023 [Populus alba x Populus x berolinensis]|uniref:Uncharacterized protein n=1 Tax=Populus alba x Populus x berolinensis TaxID=444605 RepID=A0AAD6R1D6_9ROSI|nr:hypothetical protein NC653_011023 [Populus alba x Populus x berolinensis]
MCVQCGTTSNPCRCKVVGPTVGFVAFADAAVVEWPLGAVVYLFKRMKGCRDHGHCCLHSCNTHLMVAFDEGFSGWFKRIRGAEKQSRGNMPHCFSLD